MCKSRLTWARLWFAISILLFAVLEYMTWKEVDLSMTDYASYPPDNLMQFWRQIALRTIVGAAISGLVWLAAMRVRAMVQNVLSRKS